MSSAQSYIHRVYGVSNTTVGILNLAAAKHRFECTQTWICTISEWAADLKNMVAARWQFLYRPCTGWVFISS